MKPKSWKHLALVLILAAAGVGGGALIRVFAASPKQQSRRRVEAITIDPRDCKLRWTVSRGEVKDGEYVPKGKVETYEIALHQAEMTHDGVTYQFSEQEAAAVHDLILAIGRYTAESVDWFEQQQKPVERAAR